MDYRASELALVVYRKTSDFHYNPSLKCDPNNMYRKTSNISGTLAGNKIVDHSDVVGASPVGAASTTSSFST